MATDHRIKAIIGGSIGNLVEWYDWYAYSAFSLYFAGAFFPNNDPTAQLINTAGIFAVGFIMRPVGGYIFGKLADTHGRKTAMTLSVLLMSFGSLMIALSPGYDTIGIFAPLLLLVARLLQGLSVGGEYGTSATYLSEVALASKRGFYSSFQYVTLIGGQLLAVGLQLLLQRIFLTSEQLHEWGWRIPFIIGAILSLIALYLRQHLHETAAFVNQQKRAVNKRNPLKELFKHPRAIGTVVGLTMGGTIAFYTYSTYMQKFLVNTTGLSKDESTLLTFCSLLLFALIQPLFGGLSDRIGRRPLLIAFGVLGTICTIPLFTALRSADSLVATFLLLMSALIIVSGYTAINAVVKAELFPVEVRALGVGLPYSVTVAVFGGTAEYLALWMKQLGHEEWYYYYVTGCIFISLLVYLRMSDTRKTSLIVDDTNDSL
jgi:MFS transporter, MHS family, alpha-ketoglutarate permease